MRCAACQTENRAERRFCSGCGEVLPIPCPGCGFANLEPELFCGGCGAKLHGIREIASSSEPDRRPITTLFCDLVGSTDLATSLDPEDLRELIRSYQQRATRAVTDFGGYVAQYMGDGILVFFGYPTGQEDTAERATRTALAIVDSIAGLDREIAMPLAVRVGIATGVVIAGDLVGEGAAEEAAIVGETPNLAARLQGLAGDNGIVVAESTHRLIERLFQCEDLGTVALKGFPKPQRVWRVVCGLQSGSRFEMTHAGGLARLIGREEELGVLERRWSQAKASRGQVVQLVGEGGIGKSRLVAEFKRRLAGERAAIFSVRCSPFHQHSALYPVVEFLSRWIGLSRDAEDAFAALEARLAADGLPVDESAPLLASLLGVPVPAGRHPPLALPPQRLRQLTHESICRWLLSAARRQPVLSIWEDLHWADPSTLDVLQGIVDEAADSRQLLVFTFRPDFVPAWERKPHLTSLVLRPLDTEQSLSLIDAITTGAPLPRETLEQVIVKADGVPLFVEELTHMVVEARDAAEASGAGPAPALAIPSTLHDSLMARLDRLASAKQVAQIASALGRRFSGVVLRATSGADEVALVRSLDRLVDTKILQRRGTGLAAEYEFRHALIQEAAYQSMLRKKRREVHCAAVTALNEHLPQIVEAEPEILAHHCTEGGLIDQAVTHWRNAGEKARARFANVEAVHHLQRGLELLRTLPESAERDVRELGLLIAIGLPLTATKGYASSEVGDVYGRARDLCMSFGNEPRFFPVLHGLYRFYFVRCELPAALEIVKRLLALAESGGDDGLLLEANRAVGFVLSMLGDCARAREHLGRAIEMYDPERHASHVTVYGTDPLVASLSNSAATVLWLQGEAQHAVRSLETALDCARHIGNPFNLAWTLNYAAVVHQHCGDVGATRAAADECIALSTKLEMPFWLAGGRVMQGWTRWREGRVAEGIAGMRGGIAMWRQTGAEVYLTYYLGLLAGALSEEGLVDEGLDVIGQARDHVARKQERWCEAEIERIRGELLRQARREQLLALGETDPADSFVRAIDLARKQGAIAYELRSLISLVRHEPSSANREQLADCVAAFREAADTCDLADARRLLVDLGDPA